MDGDESARGGGGVLDNYGEQLGQTQRVIGSKE
jgi:hypothetical protein